MSSGRRWEELIGEEGVKEAGKLLFELWIKWRADVTLSGSTGVLNVDGFSHFPADLPPLVPLLLMKASLQMVPYDCFLSQRHLIIFLPF